MSTIIDKNFKLIDSHCHLDFEELYNNIDEVIQNANNLGVRSIITIATKSSNFEKVKKISEKFENVWFSIGIHPHQASVDPYAQNKKYILESLNHNKCIAIGETGLDYFYNYSSKKDQIDCFKMQISIAQETQKPIIIHSRDADDDMSKILLEEFNKKPFKGVLHCFTGGDRLAKNALDIGFYISFSGIITFKNSQYLQEIFLNVPYDKYLIETDSPYLSPIPYRGKLNEPKNVYYIAKFLSSIRNISIEQIALETTKNTLDLFNLKR